MSELNEIMSGAEKEAEDFLKGIGVWFVVIIIIVFIFFLWRFYGG